jgi:hypothetical protein
MVPSCGARSAIRPTSRDELPGELWQARRWVVLRIPNLSAVKRECPFSGNFPVWSWVWDLEKSMGGECT